MLMQHFSCPGLHANYLSVDIKCKRRNTLGDPPIKYRRQTHQSLGAITNPYNPPNLTPSKQNLPRMLNLKPMFPQFPLPPPLPILPLISLLHDQTMNLRRGRKTKWWRYIFVLVQVLHLSKMHR